MQKIETSIIIVTHNGYKYVKRCIDSIYESNTKNYEIIVVDNNSTDNTPSKLRNSYKNRQNITVLELDKNYGPAYARNRGVKISNGSIIGFLDNDTLVDKNWASSAVTYLKANQSVGIVQCKLLLMNGKNKIDYVGEYLGQNGFLVQRAVTGDVDNGQFDSIVPILAAKSAGMFITKKAFNGAGGFDSEYFIYVEETDLGWRVWLKGFKVMFFPQSIVYHEFGTSSVILNKIQNNYNAKFHGCKNYILTLIKNLEVKNLIKILPLHIFLWAGLAWYTLIKSQYQSFILIHKAFLWNLLHLSGTIDKRKQIQAHRKVNDDKLFEDLMKKRSFSYFLEKAVKVKKVGNAQGFIKKD